MSAGIIGVAWNLIGKRRGFSARPIASKTNHDLNQNRPRRKWRQHRAG
jgi:hypothetical protein